jgi:hypothetical protein
LCGFGIYFLWEIHAFSLPEVVMGCVRQRIALKL